MPGTVQMPPAPNKDDIEATWAFLEQGVEKIMRDLKEGIDMNTYMGIYTAVHNFCTSAKAVQAQAGGGIIGSNAHRGAHLLGEDLYKNLKVYLKAHLQAILKESKDHSDEALLTFYIKEWDRYTTAAKYINHLFKYLNRHWVKREVDEGKKDVFDVYTLHLVEWREELFMNVKDNVMDAVLMMVEKQRNGETIEQSQIKSIVNSMVSLGLDDNDSTKATLEVYRYHFERPFIEATRIYYRKESSRFVAENSVVEYMKKAETRLEEEKNRVAMYLHTDIMSTLMKTCLQVLVTDHSTLLRDEFQTLLDMDRQEDLARMYRLLARIIDGLEPLKTKFEAHVRKSGLANVEKVAPQSEEDSLDPKVYVEALLDVHTQYAKLVVDAFNGESEFVRSLDNACKEFVNRNAVCETGSSRSPELLAKYTDNLLKKSGKSAEEADLEASLSQVMTVFKYIEDKDVFQKFYSRMLAKRLVHASSASEDSETSMISKLKEACGFEYTNKLQRMFQDMQTSKDLNSTYKDWQDKVLDVDDLKKAVDPTYNILGTGFWPLNAPTTTFIPPNEIVKTYKRFESFYCEKHSGRKLTWLWQLCKGEVKTNYLPVKTPYTFLVSTYQMAILMLFNDAETVAYEDIQKATALTPEVLDPSLGIFVKSKVMNVTPENAKPQNGTQYSLNKGFKSKKIKVNLNIAIKSEQKQEAEDTHKTIEEDRKLLIQSAIVRIMKSRKKLKHILLMQETLSQLATRFQPKPADIKKMIDQLIEKEYLERLDDEELGYLA